MNVFQLSHEDDSFETVPLHRNARGHSSPMDGPFHCGSTRLSYFAGALIAIFITLAFLAGRQYTTITPHISNQQEMLTDTIDYVTVSTKKPTKPPVSTKPTKSPVSKKPTKQPIPSPTMIPVLKPVRKNSVNGCSIGTTDIQVILDSHNEMRKKVGSPDLKWSDTLATSAQQWADSLAQRNAFEHSHYPGVGENIWAGTPGYYTYQQMVNGPADDYSWGSEIAFFKPGGSFPDVCLPGHQWYEVGHYTQCVWKATTQVGCGCGVGTATGYDGYFNFKFVCQYNPQGNFVGQKVY